jgi:protein tyrosine/serine phosphatase
MLIWLFIGFALGTLLLLFPLRTWVNYVRENELSESVEKMGVVLMMLVLVIVSFIISYKLHKWHLAKRKTVITILSLTLPFLFATGALALFMNPDIVNKGAETDEISQQFTIGPYPTESKIAQLKAEGYTGIISLLHPAVVPFEPRLLDEEETATKKFGIELVKAPMLPWIGDNTSSLEKIEKLVKAGKGKYYIHCYLGKDRVNVVKNLIAKVSGDASAIESELGATNRTFEKMKEFERGEIFKLAEDIYMTPYPTDEEFLSFFLAGKVKSVVNLMDGANPRNKKWIDKEKKELIKASVAFRHMSWNENDMKGANNIIDSILASPKPVVIHQWNTHGNDVRTFRKLFSQKTGSTTINLATNVPESY